MIARDIATLLPELILAGYAMAALLWGVFAGRFRAAPVLIWMTALVFAGLAAWIGFSPEGTRTAFGGAFTDDAFARFSKVVILGASALTLLISRDFLEREKILKFEFPLLAAFAVLGMMIMVSASDLMVLYMGLELQSLSLYVLAAFHRNDLRSTEAGIKYFVLGALSSGLLLFGASLTYGYSGTTLFSGIAEAAGGSTPFGLLYGLVFILVGLAFKISAAPFHMWVPDVYEGAPTPVTAFFSTAPKIAAIGLFARLLIEAFAVASADWQLILAILAVSSMFLGAIAAIGQRNIKRLMAYSSIAHMGFALMGLAAGTPDGIRAMLVYMVIYVVMNLGTFAFILAMRRDGWAVTDIDALSMYSRQAPARALALLVLMFSLAGIVPMVGFFAKFYVFLAAVESGLILLAIAGGIASVIGAFYYLRIVYYMYFGEPTDPLDNRMPATGFGVMLASAAIMVIGAINLFNLVEFADVAASALFS
ncbi:MAG: NADH-quinone oxidoreductase subunit NuoN [Rhodobacteraceae bacterium]|nr:NADH-quinone oxidoreductase subunit NuoN [Paracoccaceae bacterium]